jgi:hypothetical protein
MWPAVTLLVGLVGVGIGAFLSNSYALNRERRAELTGALDRLVQAYTQGDRALNKLRTEVQWMQGEKVATEAADRVTDAEILLRGAHRSMILRLEPGHRIEVAFDAVSDAFTATYLALGPAMEADAKGKWTKAADEAMATSQQCHMYFQDKLTEAIDVARKTVGAVK